MEKNEDTFLRLVVPALAFMVGALIGCFVGFAAGVNSGADNEPIENGIFTVGKAIQPGTYTSEGAANRSGCYWATLRDGTDQFASVINSQLVTTGSVTVEVSKDAVAFETNNCKPWRLVK